MKAEAIRITYAISNRHIHLTEMAAKALGINPRPERLLGLNGYYASDVRLQISGLSFRVLLPYRRYSQVECLASDCKKLGVWPCYRQSGDLEGAPLVEIAPILLHAIVALPHVHVPEDWRVGFCNVHLSWPKMVTFERIRMFPTPGCTAPVFHVDSDEGFALGLADGKADVRMEMVNGENGGSAGRSNLVPFQPRVRGAGACAHANSFHDASTVGWERYY